MFYEKKQSISTLEFFVGKNQIRLQIALGPHIKHKHQ
jgi:hypothetical protein